MAIRTTLTERFGLDIPIVSAQRMGEHTEARLRAARKFLGEAAR